jgi:hypothetical protein
MEPKDRGDTRRMDGYPRQREDAPCSAALYCTIDDHDASKALRGKGAREGCASTPCRGVRFGTTSLA